MFDFYKVDNIEDLMELICNTANYLQVPINDIPYWREISSALGVNITDFEDIGGECHCWRVKQEIGTAPDFPKPSTPNIVGFADLKPNTCYDVTIDNEYLTTVQTDDARIPYMAETGENVLNAGLTMRDVFDAQYHERPSQAELEFEEAPERFVCVLTKKGFTSLMHSVQTSSIGGVGQELIADFLVKNQLEPLSYNTLAHMFKRFVGAEKAMELLRDIKDREDCWITIVIPM